MLPPVEVCVGSSKSGVELSQAVLYVVLEEYDEDQVLLYTSGSDIVGVACTVIGSIGPGCS